MLFATLTTALFALLARQATCYQVLYYYSHFVPIQICPDSMSTARSQVVSFWIRQNSENLNKKIRFYYPSSGGTPAAAGHRVERLDIGTLPGSVSEYKAPPDGTFMWFGFVLVGDASSKCIVKYVVHTATPDTLDPADTSYDVSPSLLGAALDSGRYMVAQNYQINSRDYFLSNGPINIMFIVDTEINDTHMQDIKFVNMMKHGVGTRFMLRTIFKAIDYDHMFITYQDDRYLTAEDVLKWRYEDPEKYGVKLVNNTNDNTKSLIGVYLENLWNGGIFGVIHVYDTMMILAEGRSLTLNLKLIYSKDGNHHEWIVVSAKFTKSGTGTLGLEISMLRNNTDFNHWEELVPPTGEQDTGFTHEDFSDKRHPLVVALGACRTQRDMVQRGETTDIRYTGIVRIYNRVADIYPSDESDYSKSFNIRKDIEKNGETLHTEFWKLINMKVEIEANQQEADFDVRVNHIDLLANLMDYNWYMSSGHINLPHDYLGICYSIVPDEFKSVWHNHRCPEAYPMHYYDSTWWEPNCKVNWRWSDRRCEHCGETSGTKYYADIMDFRRTPKEMTCHTEASCAAETGYTFVTTTAIQALILSNNNLAMTKPACVSCPLSCKDCFFNEAHYRLDCTSCPTPGFSTLNILTGKCDCPVAGCTECKIATCDVCERLKSLHIASDNSRRCSQNYNCDAGFGYDHAYFSSTIPHLVHSWMHPTCRQCSIYGCQDCYSDYNMCNSCTGDRVFVAMSQASGSDYALATHCRLKTDVIQGLVFPAGGPAFVKCPNDCKVCDSNNPGICLLCYSPYAIDDNTNQCTMSYYCNSPSRVLYNVLVNTSVTVARCGDCGVTNCDICMTPTQCGICEFGYYPTGGSCLGCPTNCQVCSGANQCDICNPISYRYSVAADACVPCGVPLSGTYVDGSVCSNCISNCQTCVDGLSCIACMSSYELLSDRSACILPCSPGTLLIGNQCMQCPSNCQICDTSLQVCRQCFDNYHMTAEGICVDCSITGRVVNSNQTCMTCPAGCSTCLPDSLQCTECLYPLNLRPDHTCGNDCPAPSVATPSRVCADCQLANCGQCETATKCQTCSRGFGLTDHKACQIILFKAVHAEFNKKTVSITVTFQVSAMQVPPTGQAKVTVQDLSSDQGVVEVEVGSIERDSANQASLRFKLKTDKSVQKGELRLQFGNVSEIRSAQTATLGDGSLDPSNKTILISPVSLNWPPSADSAASKAVGSTVAVATVVATVISFNNAVILIKIYQMLDFMLLYNVRSPANFISFITIFATMDPTELVPDLLAKFHTRECAPMGEKFEQQDMGCQIFENCSLSFTLILIQLTLACLVRLAGRALRGVPSQRVHKVLKHLREGPCGHKGFFCLVAMFDIDIMIAAATNTKYYAGDSVRSFQNLFNNLLAATVTFGYPMLLGFYAYHTRLMHLHAEAKDLMSENFVSCWQFLVEEKKSTTWFQRYYEVLSLLRNYFISVAVVGLYDSPYAQVVVCLGLLSASCFLSLRYRVFESRLENIATCCSFAFYSVCTILFLLCLAIGDSLDFAKMNNLLGYPMIVSFMLLVASSMLPPLIATGLKVIKAVKSRLSKRKTSLNVYSNAAVNNESRCQFAVNLPVIDMRASQLKPATAGQPLKTRKRNIRKKYDGKREARERTIEERVNGEINSRVRRQVLRDIESLQENPTSPPKKTKRGNARKVLRNQA